MDILIEQIIACWQSGDFAQAIALTREYENALSQRRCVVCGKVLAKQAKGDYCKADRHLDPAWQEKVKESKQRPMVDLSDAERLKQFLEELEEKTVNPEKLKALSEQLTAESRTKNECLQDALIRLYGKDSWSIGDVCVVADTTYAHGRVQDIHFGEAVVFQLWGEGNFSVTSQEGEIEGNASFYPSGKGIVLPGLVALDPNKLKGQV